MKQRNVDVVYRAFVVAGSTAASGRKPAYFASRASFSRDTSAALSTIRTVPLRCTRANRSPLAGLDEKRCPCVTLDSSNLLGPRRRPHDDRALVHDVPDRQRHRRSVSPEGGENSRVDLSKTSQASFSLGRIIQSVWRCPRDRGPPTRGRPAVQRLLDSDHHRIRSDEVLDIAVLEARIGHPTAAVRTGVIEADALDQGASTGHLPGHSHC